MAIMKPEVVELFQTPTEEESYKLLKESLDDSFTVVYEPSIGMQRRRTPDFVVLSKEYGLIVLDVKFVKLDNIKQSDTKTIIKKDGTKLKNFYQTVKDYAYMVNNQLVKEFRDNPTIVNPANDKNAKKLAFPHSSGLLLFIDNPDAYSNEDIAKILSLHEKDFLVVNKIKDNAEVFEFLKNLNRPFLKSINEITIGEILKKIYIDSDASTNDFINALSQITLWLNKNFHENLEGSHFEKSKQLKSNLLEYTKFAQNSLELADKNLGLGVDNILEKLKGYKQELEDEKFTVAIFGYFSTGKSTFLNTLMNTDKLPMDEDRSTATFTRLRHVSESEEFENGDMEVIYKDELDIALAYKEAIEKLPLEDEEREEYIHFELREEFKEKLLERLKTIKIRDFSSYERDNIKNAKKILNFIFTSNIPYGISTKVAKDEIETFLTDDKKAFGISEVIYYLDNPLLKDIEIVDTPGYGSENTMDTFKTQEFVKNANVLILLTEAKDPMSKEDEHTFLETYEKIYKDENGIVNTENLFIVANKVDASQKTPQQIKKSIQEKMEDNWEDSLVLQESNIFTLSARYHYEKNLFGESSIVSSNIDENDLENFIESYARFLTENKDKTFVKNGFYNAEMLIKELQEIFQNEIASINNDIDVIQNNIKKFQENKSAIVDQYTLYSNSISGMREELENAMKQMLDKEKLNTEKGATEAYTNYLLSRNLVSNDASKKRTRKFYKKIVSSIYECVAKKNNQNYEKFLSRNVEIINREISKISKSLEEEYSISGLNKQVNVSNKHMLKSLDDIEFDKGILNSLMDVVSFGKWVNASDYAQQINNMWKQKSYGDILRTIDNANKTAIREVQNSYKDESDRIVQDIGNKLQAVEKKILAKRKDQEAYNLKIENTEIVFKKIETLQKTIEKQMVELYG